MERRIFQLLMRAKKNYNHYFSKDFEIEEPEDKETYTSQSNTLTHNNLNAFIVDWEIPKK